MTNIPKLKPAVRDWEYHDQLWERYRYRIGEPLGGTRVAVIFQWNSNCFYYEINIVTSDWWVPSVTNKSTDTLEKAKDTVDRFLKKYYRLLGPKHNVLL